MSYIIRGHAKTTRYTRDLKTCDMCGGPATQIRDFSLQLPDYYGFCDNCVLVADHEHSNSTPPIEREKEV